MTLTELEELTRIEAGMALVSHRLMLEWESVPMPDRIILAGRIHWLKERVRALVDHESDRRKLRVPA